MLYDVVKARAFITHLEKYTVESTTGMYSLEHQVEVGGEPRVGELRGSVVVVHKVDPARGRVADLPAGRQRAQLLTVDVAQVPGRTRCHGNPLHLPIMHLGSLIPRYLLLLAFKAYLKHVHV